MKYTICGFQQSELISLGLDHTDALILRYIFDFFSTDKMCQKVENNKIWFWFSYGTICEEMPILGIKTNRHIAKIMRKWEEVNLIEKMVVRGEDCYMLKGKKCSRRGVYTYFSFNPELLTRLVSSPSSEQKSSMVKKDMSKKTQTLNAEKGITSEQKSSIKDSSSIDSLFINNSIIVGSEEIKTYFVFNDWEFRSDGFAVHTKYGDKIPVRKFPYSLPLDLVQKIDELYP